MTRTTLMLLACGLLTTAAQAEKPDWAGKEKAARDTVERQTEAMQEKRKGKIEDAGEQLERERENAEKTLKKEKRQVEEGSAKQKALKDKGDNEARGLEKQRETKTDDMRRELGKGSEQGQASREEHSRKWWKFWE